MTKSFKFFSLVLIIVGFSQSVDASSATKKLLLTGAGIGSIPTAWVGYHEFKLNRINKEMAAEDRLKTELDKKRKREADKPNAGSFVNSGLFQAASDYFYACDRYDELKAKHDKVYKHAFATRLIDAINKK